MVEEDMEDPVPYITRAHFEEGLSSARKSVTEYDLDKFEQFRKKYDTVYAAKVSGAANITVNWPEDNGNYKPQGDLDDDDLYS